MPQLTFLKSTMLCNKQIVVVFVNKTKPIYVLRHDIIISVYVYRNYLDYGLWYCGSSPKRLRLFTKNPFSPSCSYYCCVESSKFTIFGLKFINRVSELTFTSIWFDWVLLITTIQKNSFTQTSQIVSTQSTRLKWVNWVKTQKMSLIWVQLVRSVVCRSSMKCIIYEFYSVYSSE